MVAATLRQAFLALGALLLALACQGGGATPSPSATGVPPTAEPTAGQTVAPTAEPTAEPTPGPLLPGLLFFSRFNESTHSNQGSFIARPNGTEEVEVPLPFSEGLARWSTSGNEITVATQLPDGRIGTAIVAPDGTVLRVLEIPDPNLNLPCSSWSADDARLACEGWADSDPTARGIYTVRASDGLDLQRLTDPAGSFDFPGGFSPDGQLVFKRTAAEEGGGPLMVVDAAGGEPSQLGTGNSYDDAGVFSPDGLLVLTAVGGSIVTLGLDGAVVSRITDNDAFLFGAVWSPDGTHIAFSRTTRGFIADIWTSLPDGTDRQQVTRTPANEIDVDWGAGGG